MECIQSNDRNYIPNYIKSPTIEITCLSRIQISYQPIYKTEITDHKQDSYAPKIWCGYAPKFVFLSEQFPVQRDTKSAFIAFIL